MTASLAEKSAPDFLWATQTSAMYAGFIQPHHYTKRGAAVVGEIHGADAGLAALGKLADPRLELFQPYWATRAHLQTQSGAITEAREAYDRAISLAVSPGERGFLVSAQAKLNQP